MFVLGEGEPSTLQEALNNPDASFWKEAMQKEIEALHKNKTWELVPLPGGRNPIRNKWVYKIKRNSDDQEERYRARLVVKGYAQKEGINFNKKNSPVVRMTTIRVVLAMCDIYDLHLEQLDVKTVFLHGNLEEEIYMLQPEGFEQKGKRTWFAGAFNIPDYMQTLVHISRGGSKSTSRYVFTLCGGTISWVSKLQSVVAMSTTEAVWLKMLLEELEHEQEKITLFCDYQSALYLARNPTFHSKTKHIRVQYHFVREKVEEGTVDMQKIHTDDNVADYLTKAIMTSLYGVDPHAA
ncbi:retrovirus-related pol polyprotein from transposon TNT 1-94 [Tanacetum coccineum]